jgi:hypothetical protein
VVDVERYALTGQLETLEQARQLLELADSPQEVKRVAEFAEAMRHVAKQAKLGLEAQNEAAEMKIHAQIKGGEMLAGMVSRGNFKKSSRSTFQLDEIGVSKYESSTWQKLSAGDHAKPTCFRTTRGGLIFAGRNTFLRLRTAPSPYYSPIRPTVWSTTQATG